MTKLRNRTQLPESEHFENLKCTTRLPCPSRSAMRHAIAKTPSGGALSRSLVADVSAAYVGAP